MFKAFVALLAVLSLALPTSAVSYYADVSVDLDSSGLATVSGTSNHPLLEPGVRDSLTSKKGGVWLFNLSLPEGDIFSDYVYAVDLPPGASVNYVRAESFRISSRDGRIRVSGSGNDRPLSVVIQYRLDGSAAHTDYSGYLAGAVALVLIVLAGLLFVSRKEKKPLKVSAEQQAKEEPPVGLAPLSTPLYSKYEGVLTDRQRDIVRILSESGKPVNQASICERLDLPKSSVSRNIASLEDIGLVEKKRVGMSTFVSLKER